MRKGWGKEIQGCTETLTGMLMRGRDPGCSQEALKATEDALEARRRQSDDPGKKICRGRWAEGTQTPWAQGRLQPGCT